MPATSLKSAYDNMAQQRDNDANQLAIDSVDEANEQDLAARSAPGSSLSAEHAAAAQAKRRRVEADIAHVDMDSALQAELVDEMEDDAPEPTYEPTERELLELTLG